MKNVLKKFLRLNSPLSIPRGFTLIELIVVITIIGILSSLGIGSYLTVKTKARDALRKIDLGQLKIAFEVYRSDQGAYPTPPLPGCDSPIAVGGSTYLQKVPCDPKTKNAYSYTATGATYQLVTCLENISDPQKDVLNIAPCTGTTNWSYTLVNP